MGLSYPKTSRRLDGLNLMTGSKALYADLWWHNRYGGSVIGSDPGNWRDVLSSRYRWSSQFATQDDRTPRRMKQPVKLAIDHEIERKFGEKERSTDALLHDR